MSVEILVDKGADLGEGPWWDHEHQHLVWVDIDKGLLHFYEPKVQDQIIGFLSIFRRKQNIRLLSYIRAGFCWALKKEFLLCPSLSRSLTWKVYAKVDAPHSKILHSEVVHCPDLSKTRFNDGKCDPSGRFWAGTMDLKEESGIGKLYMLDEHKKLHVREENIIVSNGLAWSLDKKVMYYIDSPAKKVFAYDYDHATGEIKNRRTAIDTAAHFPHAYPDGMTLDAEGMLWVAFWAGSNVSRFDPSNQKLLRTVHFPTSNTTSVSFGGPNLDELFVTSSGAHVPAEKKEKEPHRGALFVVKGLGVKGVPEPRYHGKH